MAQIRWRGRGLPGTTRDPLTDHVLFGRGQLRFVAGRHLPTLDRRPDGTRSRLAGRDSRAAVSPTGQRGDRPEVEPTFLGQSTMTVETLGLKDLMDVRCKSR